MRDPKTDSGMGRYGHLHRGSKVEVTSKEKGLLGSWFTVTVVTPPKYPASRSKKKRMTLVEYNTLVNEDGTMLLREKVDAALLRPVPPRTTGDRGFEVGDCVDAFDKDGWWTGVVEGSVGVKKEGDEESYVVLFEESAVEVVLGREELRLHLDWKDGKWFRLCDEEYQELLVRSDGFVDVTKSSCSSDPKGVIILSSMGDAPKVNSVAVGDNPSMEELSLAAVGTEPTNMEPGHSHLVKNDGMNPGREATVIGLSMGQQPTCDDVEMTQSLPFVKRSPIWKYLESLEVLQKFPQKPHFLPLIEVGERTREEYAIAKMVTFASTLEDAIKLSINDPVSIITDCLETFDLLESHGFDAKTVESRLRMLLSLKDKQQKMNETKNEVERQISELTHKRVKLAADICETDHKIKVYEQQLALVFLEEEEVGRKISILKTSLDVMETVMHSALPCLMDESTP